jgi:hypothetical protein
MNLFKYGLYGLFLVISTQFASTFLLSNEPDYLTLKYGKDNNYELKMRAIINKDGSEFLEMKACFPENTWFGIGFGGYLMTNTELVFFMAPTNKSLTKVISTRMNGTRSTRP